MEALGFVFGIMGMSLGVMWFILGVPSSKKIKREWNSLKSKMK